MKQTRLIFALAAFVLVVLPIHGYEVTVPAKESQGVPPEGDVEAVPEPSGDALCEELNALEPWADGRELMAQPTQVCGFCPPLNDCGTCAVDSPSCHFVDTGQKTCDVASSQRPPCGATCPVGLTLHYEECDCVTPCPIATTKRALQCF